jgi:hypothetical protein
MEENCRKTCDWCLGRKLNNPTSSGSLNKFSVFISVINMEVFLYNAFALDRITVIVMFHK